MLGYHGHSKLPANSLQEKVISVAEYISVTCIAQAAAETSWSLYFYVMQIHSEPCFDTFVVKQSLWFFSLQFYPIANCIIF